MRKVEIHQDVEDIMTAWDSEHLLQGEVGEQQSRRVSLYLSVRIVFC
jgi:hypothetical protein